MEITASGGYKKGEFRYSTDKGETWSDTMVIGNSPVRLDNTADGEFTGLNLRFGNEEFLIYDDTELRDGDVVTYKNPAVPFTITHRIVEVTERGFVTKGDNLCEDDGEIPGEWVKYRVVGRGW